MIDYIGLFVMVIALFIGFFPLLFKKNRSGDFLVCYVDRQKKEKEKQEREDKI